MPGTVCRSDKNDIFLLAMLRNLDYNENIRETPERLILHQGNSYARSLIFPEELTSVRTFVLLDILWTILYTGRCFFVLTLELLYDRHKVLLFHVMDMCKNFPFSESL